MPKCCLIIEVTRASILVFSYIYMFIFLFATFAYTVFGILAQLSPDRHVRSLTFWSLAFIVPLMIMRVIVYFTLIVGIHTDSFELVEIYIISIAILVILGIIMTMVTLFYKQGWAAILDLLMYLLEPYMAYCIYLYMMAHIPVEDPSTLDDIDKI